MSQTSFITEIEKSLSNEELLVISMLSIPSVLNNKLALEILDFDKIKSDKEKLLSNVLDYPVWKRLNKGNWVLENSVRIVFQEKLNGSSNVVINHVYNKLSRSFKEHNSEISLTEQKDYEIQLSRLCLSIPNKQEKGINTFRAFYDLAEKFNIKKTSEIINLYFDQSLKINEGDVDFPPYILNALFMKGMYAYKTKNNEDALKYLKLVWELHDNSIDRIRDAAIASHIVGLIWSKDKTNSIKSKKAFLESIKMRETVGDMIGLAQTYHSLGNLYSSQKIIHDAEICFKKSIELDILNENEKGVAQVYHSWANLLSQIPGRYDEAKKYYKKSIELDSNNFSLAQVYHSFANLLAKLKDEIASEYYIESIKIGRKINNRKHLAQVYMSFGMYKKNTQKFQEALFLLNEALKYERKYEYILKINSLIDEIKNN